jgi:hypothetical protein
MDTDKTRRIAIGDDPSERHCLPSRIGRRKGVLPSKICFHLRFSYCVVSAERDILPSLLPLYRGSISDARRAGAG